MTLKLITHEKQGSIPIWLWIVIAIALVIVLISVMGIAIGVFAFIVGTTDTGSNCTSDNTQIIYVYHTMNESALNLTLQNGAGQTIAVTSIDVDGVTFEDIVPIGGDATANPIDPVSGSEFGITGVEGPASGTYRGTVTVNYTRGSSSIAQAATLTCTGTAS